MIKHYVGARYVPKFASPLEWAADTSYEALTIVTFNNASYTSKVPVPPTVGDPADNPDYWALTGNYNAQVDQYRQETETVSNNLTTEITNRKNADNTLQAEFDELSENKADIIVSSASGAIASFPDGAALPVRDLSVDIEPVQDLHGYDHPWPAGGGKNKFDVDKLVNVANITVSNGVITVTGNAHNSTKKLGELADLVIGETYTLTATTDGTENIIYLYGTGANTNWSFGNNLTVTQAHLDALVFFYGGNNTTSHISNMMIRLSSVTDATFAPYSNICPITGWTGSNVTVSPTTDAEDGHTYSITFPGEAGTVYGGTLDVTKGELVVDRVLENKTWGELTDATVLGTNERRKFSFSMASKYVMVDAITDFLCNTIGVYNISFSADTVHMYVANGNYAWLYLPNGTDSLTVIQLSYTIATPITYHLTPQEITTLLGQNNIWADTGDTSVTYKADTKLYIDKKFTELQALILEN